MVETQAAVKGLLLRSDAAMGECIAVGDRVRIDQIPLNPLSNAIKCAAGGSQGKVRIYAYAAPARLSSRWLLARA